MTCFDRNINVLYIVCKSFHVTYFKNDSLLCYESISVCACVYKNWIKNWSVIYDIKEDINSV